MGTMKVLGTALYQWEIGRKICITPAPGTTVSAVHFAHPGDSEAPTVIPREENGLIVADIPNYLLQSGRSIVAFLVDVDENKIETTSDRIFSVINRPKPADYVYTETEVLTWYSLEKRIKNLEENSTEVPGGGIVQETDPTVPAWAKQPEKPTYTAAEVGALPSSTVIPTVPTKVSAFENDKGYLTEHQDLSGYAKNEDIPTKPEDIGAQPAGNYLTEVPSGYATEKFVTDKIAEAELGGGGSDSTGGYEVLIDITTTEAVTEFQSPVMDAAMVQKFNYANEVFLYVSVPFDKSDTVSNETGNVTVSLFGNYLMTWFSNIGIIPNPTETWTKDGYIFAKVAPTPHRFATIPRTTGIDQYVWGIGAKTNYGGVVTRVTTVEIANMTSGRSYFKVAGSRSMPAGARLVVGVVK